MYHEFVVPTDEDYLRVLGMAPERTGDAGVAILTFEDTSVCAELTIDIPGRAVSLRLRQHGAEILLVDMYREGATQLRLSDKPPEVSIEFRSDGSKGSLGLAVRPSIAFKAHELLA